MSRITLSSREIAAVDYDPEALRLEVELRKGDVYEIDGVPETIYQTLITCESPGTYYHLHIRKGDYKMTRLR
ncbi:KTSC domain-containing protein [Rhizobium sp. KAs_5_22]|uniref:KTSC domain-containing protein n=1 Tax=Ciceribacter selenitireducens TaxID=448181 RepID=UPI00048F9A29|nr:KTSC domain-containing protein [Ciceribacter selenitireducens]PPJ47395.1 KTSC domain-containing protein [Rhizobium sp. KAs_5_22]